MSDRIRETEPETRAATDLPLAVLRATVRRAGRGFTLVELMVVMVIIGILLAFILNASMNSVKRAQERATQTLITKLEGGLNDRLAALMQRRPEPNSAHLLMGSVWNSGTTQPMAGLLRAQVIAWYDYVKREMPDTFFVQNTSGPYPLNFAANPYPLSGGTPTDPNGLGQYILPMGNSIGGQVGATAYFYGDGSGSGYSSTSTGGLMEYNPSGIGIYGASYPVAAGLYRNLGYLPAGYDGVDNNQNGMVDEWQEGVTGTNQALVQANLANHKHITARSEMLYAVLVEGQGPLGSVFNRDEFTDREVQDTDGDGLPEFVDAWGNPLQFFRWPLLYHSGLQRGQVLTADGADSWTLTAPFVSMFEQREQNPMDANQQLVAPAWWSNMYNNSSPIAGYPTPDSSILSGPAQAFEYYFHRLVEPVPGGGGAYYWDRGAIYGSRRAFYSKFLVASGGLDGQLGIFLYSDAALSSLGTRAAWALIANENNALPFSVTDTSGGFTVDFTSAAHNQYSATQINYTESDEPSNPSTGQLLQAAGDDITNQNIQVTVGIGGGG